MNVPKPPSHWRQEISPYAGAGNFWSHKIAHLNVMRSLSTTQDGSKWIHISLSRPDRLPTWEEVGKVRNEFLGEEWPAYHAIPPKSSHVNVHSFCLHIWAPVPGQNPNRIVDLFDLINEEAI